MSHKFSVTRGLVQLKRLEQRINKKIDILEEFVVANKVSSTKVKDGLYTKDQFTAKAKSEWDSLNDLISLRKEIKDAIVQSNAKTKVIICGREYTIAQAIERKNAIPFKNFILREKMPFHITKPPLTLITSPVIKEAPSPARKSAAAATSEGSPLRRRALSSARSASSSGGNALFISVSITPGAMAFTVIPEGPSSLARALVIPIRPAFAVE